MPREKQIGTCTECGKEKPLFDVKNKICGSCAGKKGGGRPKALLKKPAETPEGPLSSASAPGGTRKPADTTRQKSISDPTVTGDALQESASNGGEKYLCESCGGELRYGQRKCRCGVWADWRGTSIETDPDLVMCPECGAICGHEGNATKCPHCNYGDN